MARLDMTDGVYRRIYSGFLDNKKINRLSWMAEAWFWRLVVLADDYGNVCLNWRALAVEASPVREVSTKQAKELTVAVVEAKLAFIYVVDGVEHLHITGFMDKQPAGKNGRRIQRLPMHPDEPGTLVGNPGESGGIQNNPRESKKIQGSSVGIQNNPGESSPSYSDTNSNSYSDTENVTKTETPQPPKGGGDSQQEQVASGESDKTAKGNAKTPPLAAVASVLESRGFGGVEFANALAGFYRHRKEMGRPITMNTAAALAAKFESVGQARAIQAMRDSVANGWQGVFPEKTTGAAARPPGSTSVEEAVAEMQRRREANERRTA